MKELSRIKWLSRSTQTSLLFLLPLIAQGQVRISELSTLGGSSINAYQINPAGHIVGNSFTSGNQAQHAFLSRGGVTLDLGTLGGSSSSAFAINNADHVVGASATANNTATHAFWHNGVSMLSLGTLGGSFSSALAINNNNQIAGDAYLANSHNHAFLYSGGVMIDLRTLGGTYSSATALNESGWVAGESYTTNNQQLHAFVYNGASLRDLGTLGGTYSTASGLNDAGFAAGESTTRFDAEVHAFLHNGQQMFDLGTLGGSYSTAYAINSAGVVMGDAFTAGDLELRAFVFANAGMIDLGTLGGDYSSSWAINSQGQVVGESSGPNFGSHAFLWENGVMTDLNSLLPPNSGWVLFVARMINDAGQIVGYGLYNGAFKWFVLELDQPAPNSPPVAHAGADQTVECAGNLTRVLLDGTGSNDPDNDPLTYSWSWNGNPLGAGPALAVDFPAGSFVLNLEVADPAGASSSDTVTVLVRDSVAPTITCPPTVVLSANANGQALIPNLLGLLVAADNCSAPGALVLAQEPLPNSVVGVGQIVVALSAMDEAGHRAVCAVTVQVVDATPPTIVCPGNVTLTLGMQCEAALPDFVANLVVGDNVTPRPQIVVTQQPPAGTMLGAGLHTVTLTAQDAAGNQTSCTVVVSAVDQTAPQIRSIVANPSVLSPPNGKMIPVTLRVDAVDNCDSAPRSRIVAVQLNGQNPGADAVVTGDLTVQLRARKGKGTEESIYTVVVESSDSAGNIQRGNVQIEVSNQKK